MNEEYITLNFCEKCRKGFGSDELKRNLHNELLCLECYASYTEGEKDDS